MSQPLFYRGLIPASKSILNRLLVLQSFAPDLLIEGDSAAEDVVKMKSALASLSRGEPADCGAAGTTLRFLALRASRRPGTHHLSGTLRLFERPQGEIKSVLAQLGSDVEVGPQRMTIRGEGWKIPSDGIRIDRSVSSQFASGLFLSAWDLPKPLRVRFEGDAVSEGYLDMTLALTERFGLVLDRSGSEIVIAAGSKPKAGPVRAEIDVSSAFAVAAVAVAKGQRAEFLHWPAKSLQPDAGFSSLLARMGCQIEEANENGVNVLKVGAPVTRLEPVDCNLTDCPDLFPVLATLCAFAKGKSTLRGAPHLAHKESNRIAKSQELVSKLGRKCVAIDGGLEIHGAHVADKPLASFAYDVDHDHRLAMAAAVAEAFGAEVRVSQPNVVAKSFPEFWDIARGPTA